MAENVKIALLINPSRQYTRGILSGIAEYARLQGLWTFYRPLEYRERQSGRRLRAVLEALEPDGILMREPEEMDAIVGMGVPIVCFPYTRETIDGVANVITDHRAISEVGAGHLLSLGLRHFGYCGLDDWWWSRRRRNHFREEVGRHGFEVDVYQLPSAPSQRSWDQELPRIGRWLRGLAKPVGIMTCNDDRGGLVIEACKLEGLKVPDEVAVVGVDNDALICDLCSPPLSSVASDLQRIGYEAARMLDQMISGQEKGRPTLCIRPTHVAARQSTDVLAIGDGEVVTALRFIRRSGRLNIGVQQVVEHTRLSRRALEQRFRSVLGHSIHDEIERVRIELLMRLLVETRQPLAEIAQMLGFSDASHASRLFRKVKGISPMTYRRQYQC
jgi:LacI family transcriptional regulator